MSTQPTSIAAVLGCLQSGRKLSPQDIGRECHIQHNTAVKDIKFLRDAGHDIKKELIDSASGRKYYRYWIDIKPAPIPAKPVVTKEEKPWLLMSVEEKIAKLLKLYSEYPCEHREAKLMLGDILKLKGIVDDLKKRGKSIE
jgi:hypothetical protein